MMTTADISVSGDWSELRDELDQVQSKIIVALERAGVELDSEKIAELADDIFSDAVRIAMLWLGESPDIAR